MIHVVNWLIVLLTTRQVMTIARSLGRLQRDHGLPIDPEENIKLNLNFGLVDVVYEWARGVPFCEITQVLTGTCVTMNVSSHKNHCCIM